MAKATLADQLGAVGLERLYRHVNPRHEVNLMPDYEITPKHSPTAQAWANDVSWMDPYIDYLRTSQGICRRAIQAGIAMGGGRFVVGQGVVALHATVGRRCPGYTLHCLGWHINVTLFRAPLLVLSAARVHTETGVPLHEMLTLDNLLFAFSHLFFSDAYPVHPRTLRPVEVEEIADKPMVGSLAWVDPHVRFSLARDVQGQGAGVKRVESDPVRQLDRGGRCFYVLPLLPVGYAQHTHPLYAPEHRQWDILA